MLPPMSQKHTRQYEQSELGVSAFVLALSAFGLAVVALVFG